MDLLKRLFPASIRGNKEILAQALRWLLIGLFVRLVFMPIAVHTDFLLINKALHYFSVHGVINVYKYIHLHPTAAGDFYTYPPLSYFLLGTFQFLLRPVMPYLDRMAEAGSNNPNLFPYLFTMKLPYLLFDVAGALFLLRFFDSTEEKLRAYKFWMINPIVIFGTYLMGQFDIIPTFFIIIAFYFVYRKDPIKSLLFLGLSAALKNFALLLILPFVLIQGRSLKDYVKLTFFGLLPYLLTTGPFMFSSYYRQASMLASQNKRLFDMQLSIGYGQSLYVFIIGYVFVLALAFYYKREGSFREVLNISLAAFILLYAFSLWNPQWLIWIMPLLAIQFALDRRMWPYHLILFVSFIFITFWWGKDLAGALFMPLNSRFFAALPAPSEVIGRFISANGLINFFRTVFAGTSLWIAYQALRSMSSTDKSSAVDNS